MAALDRFYRSWCSNTLYIYVNRQNSTVTYSFQVPNHLYCFTIFSLISTHTHIMPTLLQGMFTLIELMNFQTIHLCFITCTRGVASLKIKGRTCGICTNAFKKGTYTNSIDPDETPQKAASH